MSAGGGRGRAKKGGGHEEGHENSERWLLTYADMITLLMVLFIVMFAISQVDQKKFAMLAEGLAAGFNNPVKITPGNDTVLAVAPDRTAIVDVQDAVPADVRPRLAQEVATGQADTSPQDVTAAAKAAAEAAARAKDTADLDKAESIVEEALKKAGMDQRVMLTRDGRGLTITVIVDDLVFPAHRAELGEEGKNLLRVIAPALLAVRHNVLVEGHTNTVNVEPLYYPSEWELSSARASSTVRFLIEQGLPPKLMMAAGFADTRPLLPDSDPRSVRMNRRVAIVVLSSLTTEGGAEPGPVDLSESAPPSGTGTGSSEQETTTEAAADAAAAGGGSDG